MYKSLFSIFSAFIHGFAILIYLDTDIQTEMHAFSQAKRQTNRPTAKQTYIQNQDTDAEKKTKPDKLICRWTTKQTIISYIGNSVFTSKLTDTYLCKCTVYILLHMKFHITQIRGYNVNQNFLIEISTVKTFQVLELIFYLGWMNNGGKRMFLVLTVNSIVASMLH